MDQQTKNQLIRISPPTSIQGPGPHQDQPPLLGPVPAARVLKTFCCMGRLSLVLFLVWGASRPVLAGAGRWVLPPGVSAEVQISNSSRYELELYTKELPAAGPSSEQGVVLPAGQTVSVKLKTNQSVNLMDAMTDSLKLLWIDQNSGQQQTLPHGQGNLMYFTPSALSEEGELVLTNLSSQSQDGRILSRRPDSLTPASQPFILKSREVLSINGAGLSGSAFLQISASYNISAHWKSRQRIEFPDLGLNPNPLPPPQGRYFVVGNEKRSIGYLVDLTDPTMIAEAREQIRKPDNLQARILIAEIAVNQNLENRNWYDKHKHPWSWKIVRPIRFASLASQVCDGHPQMIEDQLEAWLGGAGGHGGRPVICLWSYQVLEELP